MPVDEPFIGHWESNLISRREFEERVPGATIFLRNIPMTIAVAVSGGADSLYALASLHREHPGQVIAFHAHLKDALSEEDPVPGLSLLCADMGIPFHVIDLRETFSHKVIRPFAESYAKGETPNPCVRCNALVKFGLWMDEARKLGADRIATGHYVSLVEHPRYGLALHQGADDAKDQSYFLALTPIERLRKAVFPLARIRKSEVRAALSAWGLPVPIPQESQEICFVPNDDYRSFLRKTGMRLPAGGGPMVLVDGHVVGRHNGLWQYTEGQRRGLGVSWAEPLYVIGKDRSRNALVLGTAAELPVNGCASGTLNFLVPPSEWPHELRVRTRYRQKAVPADVRLVGGGESGMDGTARMLIRFHQPQLPSAPGQLAAVFDEYGHVLAGGIICKEL